MVCNFLIHSAVDRRLGPTLYSPDVMQVFKEWKSRGVQFAKIRDLNTLRKRTLVMAE